MTRETAPQERLLLRRARVGIGIVIAGLVLSGLTAFPLESELRLLTQLTTPARDSGSALHQWLCQVRDALADTNARYPFLAYGTDWLAFAHLVIAFAFVGPLRDPVRNAWVIVFGLVACAGVPLLALIAGPARGIPLGWRLVDCSFGVACALPLAVSLRAVRRLEARSGPRPSDARPAQETGWPTESARSSV